MPTLRTDPSAQLGLTLMELLVALVILSLTVGLGMQSLLSVERTQRSALAATDRSTADRLREVWVREGLEALASDPKQPIQGRGTRIAAFSRLDLAGIGVGGNQAWELQGVPGGVRLRITQEGGAAPLDLFFMGVNKAQFRFIDEDGGVLPQWPPSAPDTGPGTSVVSAAPKAIALLLEREDGSVDAWIAGLKNPRPPSRLLIDEGETP